MFDKTDPEQNKKKYTYNSIIDLWTIKNNGVDTIDNNNTVTIMITTVKNNNVNILHTKKRAETSSVWNCVLLGALISMLWLMLCKNCDVTSTAADPETVLVL